MIPLILFAIAGGLAAGLAVAQQPDVINGKRETRALNGPLDQEFQKIAASAASPLWFAYEIPAVPGQGTMCGSGEYGNAEHNKVVRLEGPGTLLVLFRFENRALDRVRISSPDCQFDAGGLAFIFLTGVQPSQSVDLLAGLAHRSPPTGQKAHFDSLIAGIALTRDPSADRALEAMLTSSQPDSLREKALFWMAKARGASGFAAVRKVLQSDPNDKIREHATFAVSISQEADAIPTLIQAARQDRAANVRSQALLWIARKAGMQQSAMILQAAQQDADEHVRRQAVFALQQIPNGEGIPLLIQLARTSMDKEVKKQAVFWLGRSHDPRATGFFAEILK